MVVEDSIASKSHENYVELGLSKWGRMKQWKNGLNILLILSFPYDLTLESNLDSLVPFFNWNFTHWTT